jgi:eukaryotic-like serine/threonine-protein kinase
VTAPGNASFGRYEMVAALGADAAAEVFLASEIRPDGSRRMLVLKRFRGCPEEDPALEEIERSAGVARHMDHPNVVRVLDVGQCDGHLFIVTELVDGRALQAIREHPERGGRFSRDLEFLILSEALAGLHYAHELRDPSGSPLDVVHGRCNPQNIVVTLRGHVKLVEFAMGPIVKRVGETKRRFAQRVRYLAPEQATGSAGDRRADLFAVGVMIWEAATASRLWGAYPDSEVLARLAGGSIPIDLRRGQPVVPLEIDEICRRALAFSPDARYATAAELKKDLDAFLDSRGFADRRAELASAMSELFSNERSTLGPLRTAQPSASTSRDESEELPVLWSEDESDGLTSRLAALTEVMAAPDEATRLRPSILAGDGSDDGANTQIYVPKEVPDTGGDPLVVRPVFARKTRPAAPVRGGSMNAQAAARRPQSRFLLPVAALGAFGMILVGMCSRSSSPADASKTSAAVVTSASAKPAAHATEDDTIAITLSAAPSSAQFTIDNGPPLGNPYRGRVHRDEWQHVVRIAAPNYDGRAVQVFFTKDVVVEVALERGKPRSEGAPPTTRGALHPSSSAEPVSSAVAPRVAAERVAPPPPLRVTLDLSDPWLK